MQTLIDRGDTIAVFTQPDRPVGRKAILTPPPVKVLAQSHGIPVFQFEKIRSAEGVDALSAFAPDLAVTAAFGQLLSADNLAIPKFGTINVHGSLLPKYRGASPIQTAILNGDTMTGVTTMFTDIGMDTGDILLKKEIAIDPDDTSETLSKKLSEAGALLLKETLSRLEAGTLVRIPQNNDEASKCRLIRKEDGKLDFSKTTQQVHNRVRAMNPWPVSFASLDGQPLKFFETQLCDLAPDALPIGTLHGCGKSTAQKLQLIGINTIGEAAAADLTLLQSVLGQKSGAYIWNSANGISRSRVEPEREQAKSVSNERTLAEDITRDNYLTDGVPVICMLSEKVAGRMQKSSLTGQTVTFQVKSSDFERYSRQMSLPDMTDRASDIEAAALLLADKLLNGPDGLFESGISIRLIGVGVSRISEKQIHQMDLFEWADRNEEDEKVRRAEEEARLAVEKARKAEEEIRRAQEETKQLAKRARQAKRDEMMEKVNSRYGDGTLKKGNKKDNKSDDH